MSALSSQFLQAAKRVIIKLYCPLCNKKHDFVLVQPVKKGGRREEYHCTTPGCTYSVWFTVK